MIAAAGIVNTGSTTGAGVAPSLLTETGVGIGALSVTVALLLVLAYLNLLQAADRDVDKLTTAATAAAIPLSLTFAATIVFEALAVL